MQIISQFTTNVRYVKSLDNSVGNALPRCAINAISWPKGGCRTRGNGKPTHSKGLKLERVPLAIIDGSIISDISAGRPRPLFSPSMSYAVLDCLHGLEHPGIPATLKIVTSRFVRPGMNVDVHN